MATKKRTTTTDVVTPTSIHVILDRSGSMESIREATIEGYNAYLAQQATVPGARFSLTQFDTVGIDHLYVDVPVERVEPLTTETFVPRGGTPLYDAIGTGIAALEAATPTGKVVFVIVTDGQENSSREYTREAVLARIEARRKDGWEFVFMGATADTYEVGASLGVDPRSTYRYAPTAEEAPEAFHLLSMSTLAYRTGAAPMMDLSVPSRTRRPRRPAGGDGTPAGTQAPGSVAMPRPGRPKRDGA